MTKCDECGIKISPAALGGTCGLCKYKASDEYKWRKEFNEKEVEGAIVLKEGDKLPPWKFKKQKAKRR